MPHALQQLFLPLHRLAHRPDGVDYQHRVRRWMIDRVFATLDQPRVGTVLEVGCGDGWLSHELLGYAQRVVGFDINLNRIEPPRDPRNPRILLVAGEAERSPIRAGSVDLIVSVAVLEHIVDRGGAVRQQAALLKPGGLIVQIVPTAPMKVLQWIGFLLDKARKDLRGLTRALAGRRTRRDKGKFHTGRETNNPHRASRRAWWQRLYPRVHGEYDSNWQEFLNNRDKAWRRSFEEAGFEVVHDVRLGCHSPYFFGLAPLARAVGALGLASVRAYVLRSREGQVRQG